MTEEGSPASTPNRLAFFSAIGAGVLAACLYLSTICPAADVGLSARLIASHFGLFPRYSALHPLWHAVAKAAVAIQPGTLAVRVNRLSALLGLLAVGLLCELTFQVLRRLAFGRSAYRREARRAAALGAWTAAAALAGSFTFWTAATRADPLTLHAVLLLVCARLLFAFLDTGRPRTGVVLAFLFGAFACEVPLLIPLAPIAGALVLLRLFLDRRLTPAAVAPLILAGAAGLTGGYILAAALYVGEPGAALRGCATFTGSLSALLRDQVASLRFALPKTGWLLIGAFTLVPWLTAAFMARDSLSQIKSAAYASRPREWSYPILHAVFTLATAIALLRPALLRLPPALPLSTLLLQATLAGYLVAFWRLWPLGWWEKSTRPWKLRTRAVAAAALPVPMAACVIAAAWLTAGRVDTTSCRLARSFARAVLLNAPEARWILTDGMLDDHIKIAARDAGRACEVINLPLSRHPTYQAYVATLLPDDRLRNLAQVGVDVAFREWAAESSEAASQIAVQGQPGFWLAAGLTPIPAGVVHLGAPELAATELPRLFARHTEFWDDWTARLRLGDRPPARAAVLAQHLLGLSAHVAWDLGRLLDRHGHGPRAQECYRRAETMAPGVTSRRSGDRTGGGVFDLAAEEAVRDAQAATPESAAAELLRRAYRARVEGRLDEAADTLRAATDAGAPPEAVAVETAMIAIARGRIDEAAATLQRHASERGLSVPAWAMLAGLSQMRGDTAAMRRCLDELERRAPGATPTMLVRSQVALLDGRIEEARDALAQAIGRMPPHPLLLRQMILCYARTDRMKDAEAYAVELLRLDIGDGLANHIRGRRQFERGELTLAEDSYRRALREQRRPETLNDLAWLLQEDGRLEEAEALAREALRLQPAMPHAWDTLGAVLRKQGRPREAEEAFLACLSIRPAGTGALLALAELKAESGDLAAAREYLRKLDEAAGADLPPPAAARADTLRRRLE